MKSLFALVWLELYTRRRRILALAAFGALYIAAALVFRAIAKGEHGQVEPEALFGFGGYALVSAMLLSGWSIARFPMVIAVVLVAGLFSGDVAAGYARLYAATRVRLYTLYGLRLAMLLLLAFVMSAVLLIAFDAIMLGKLPGPGLFVLVLSYLLVFGALTAFFSAFTRGDAWIAIFVALVSMVWHAMLRGGLLAEAPMLITQVVTVVLPPHTALDTIERAFGSATAIPWGAFLYVCMYSALVLMLAGVAISRREI